MAICFVSLHTFKSVISVPVTEEGREEIQPPVEKQTTLNWSKLIRSPLKGLGYIMISDEWSRDANHY